MLCSILQLVFYPCRSLSIHFYKKINFEIMVTTVAMIKRFISAWIHKCDGDKKNFTPSTNNYT